MMMNTKLVGLVRVSTDKQGRSGLGLEAQRAMIEEYAARTGAQLVRIYTEVESGGHDDLADRPEVLRAISHTKRANAVLCVAKLDRLVRSTVAMTALKVAKVKFVACDSSTANEFTIDIHVAVSADERRRISDRTKQALKAYRARGGLLGASLPQCRNLDQQAREKGARRAGEAHRRNADDAYRDVAPLVGELRGKGLSQREIAERLNDEGYETRAGKPWGQVQVCRLLKRFPAASF